MNWQPISTAPKDGTSILVFAQEGEFRCAVGEPVRLPSLVAITAWHPDAGFFACPIRDVTHWMPLPEPPA